jgi:hypothetical protein
LFDFSHIAVDEASRAFLGDAISAGAGVDLDADAVVNAGDGVNAGHENIKSNIKLQHKMRV